MDYSEWGPGQVAVYLDDVRVPRPSHFFEWVVVRSFKEFTRYILQQGMPKMLSFDHDLADEHIRIGAAHKWKDFDYSLCQEMTGYDAAKWLVEYCLDNDVLMPHTSCHSANPAGAENIVSLLNNFYKHQGQEPTCYRTVW